MPVYVIDTLKPKNGLDFPVVEAVDVAVEGYSNLADAVTHFATDTAIATIAANLQAQIDQIEISASAESIVAPEVAAARVGTDGTEYNTLKMRLDAENTKHLKYEQYSSDEIYQLNTRLSEYDGNVYAAYEAGNADASGGTIVYASSDSRIRMIPDTWVHLPVGALFTLTNYTNAEFLLLRKNGGTVIRAVNAWKSANITINVEDDYYFVVKTKDNTAISDISDLSSLVKVILPNCTTDDVKALQNTAKTSISNISDLQNDISQLSGSVFAMYEIGNADAVSGTVVYASSNSRIRMLPDTWVHLPVDTIFSLTDYTSAEFLLLRRNSGTVVRAFSTWRSSDFTLTAEDDYYIVVKTKTDTAISDVTELSSLIKITLPSYATKDIDLLKEITTPLTEIDCSEYDGYITFNNQVSPPNEINQEKYTSRIDVSYFSSINFSLDLTGTEHTQQWIAVAEYRKDGSFERVQLVSMSKVYAEGTYDIPDDVSEIAFTYRSYGSAKIKLSAFVNKSILRIIDEKVDKKTSSYTAAMFSSKPCYDHLFVNQNAANIIIPHESLYHVRFSKKLGFDMIEANVYKTSDGVYIVNHLENGKFGKYFHHVDEETDISNIAVSSVTWDWIVQNVRYNSQISKYRTRPCRLEEFLSECRQQNLKPFIQINSDAEIATIADSIMGKGNYIAYGASRAICPNAMIYHWKALTTKEDILSYCESIGLPFTYGMSNPTAFTDEQLRDIVDTLHQKGYMIGTSYADTKWYHYSYLGFDMLGAQSSVNRIKDGNLFNFSTIFNFNDFIVVGGEEGADGSVSWANNGIIAPNFESEVYPICEIDIEIWFNGSITIPLFGLHGSTTYESDGTAPVFISTIAFNRGAVCSISVDAGTTIYDISYKASSI